MAWIWLIPGVLVGWWIMRIRWLRSLRVFVLVTGCTLLAVLVSAQSPTWTRDEPVTVIPVILVAFAAASLVCLPIALLRRFEVTLSALPPDDLRELKLLVGVRTGLGERPTSTQAHIALDILEAREPITEEWRLAREALKEQIRLAFRSRGQDETSHMHEMKSASERTNQVWREAIAKRKRFFR